MKFVIVNIILIYDKSFIWGLGIGDWGMGGGGLGNGDLAQTPNPQSPIPNPQSPLIFIQLNLNINL